MFCQDQINHGKKIKIITPKQMLQRLPIALVRVKTDNASQDVLDKIREKKVFLVSIKKNYEKVFDNLIKPILKGYIT